MPWTEATSWLENLATDYLTRRARAAAPPDSRRVSRAACAELKRQERRTILFACLAGATAGAALGAVEIALAIPVDGLLDLSTWRGQLPRWTAFLALTLAISGAEIAFLYWNALRMATRYTAHTGVQLLPEALEQLRARALARAALELPDPREPVYGIDPTADVPRWKHVASMVLYRLKIGTTNLVMRALFRRVLGRAAVRFFLPLTGIPVFVVWNGLITWWALRQARLRAFGALAVRELSDRIDAERARLSPTAGQLIVDVVAEALVRSQSAHPNPVLLLGVLIDQFDVPEDQIQVDWDSCCSRVTQLGDHERRLLLDALALAIVLDGRPRPRQRQLLEDACRACGQPCAPDRVTRLQDAIAQGQGTGD